MKSYKFGSLDGVGLPFIVNVCSKMLSNEMDEVYDFDRKNYRWYVGGNVFNRLIDIMGLQTLTTIPIGEILGIDVAKSYSVESNEIQLRVRANFYGYTTTFNLDAASLYPKLISSRHNGKTMTSLKILEENMKKLNFNRVHDVSIKNVIFNDPATIVFWNDSTKTVVKAENEPFDPEKGLAMAIAKKFFGNEGNYYETFKKWLPKKED